MGNLIVYRIRFWGWGNNDSGVVFRITLYIESESAPILTINKSIYRLKEILFPYLSYKRLLIVNILGIEIQFKKAIIWQNRYFIIITWSRKK